MSQVRDMDVKTGDKPFKCEHCVKLFVDKTRLVRHVKVYDKAYTCNHCMTSFAEKGTLVKHMRVHTGEKPV
jgi:KRAB domain-containing zinc finger protein